MLFSYFSLPLCCFFRSIFYQFLHFWFVFLSSLFPATNFLNSFPQFFFLSVFILFSIFFFLIILPISLLYSSFGIFFLHYRPCVFPFLFSFIIVVILGSWLSFSSPSLLFSILYYLRSLFFLDLYFVFWFSKIPLHSLLHHCSLYPLFFAVAVFYFTGTIFSKILRSFVHFPDFQNRHHPFPFSFTLFTS